MQQSKTEVYIYILTVILSIPSVLLKACEKALKAAWLATDANKFARKSDQHSLSTLEMGLNDVTLRDTVCQFML